MITNPFRAIAAVLLAAAAPAVAQQTPVVVAAQGGDDPDTSDILLGKPWVACGDIPRLVDGARHGGQALFVVTPTGQVLTRTRAAIREGESVQVLVVGPPDAIADIAVRRISPFRELDTYPIVGQNVTVPPIGAPGSSGLVATDSECGAHYETVANFAGGRAGEVAVRRARMNDNGTADSTRLGSFDFPVSRTYAGALSLGVTRSWLSDPRFEPVDADSVVTRQEDGPRVLYTLFFTPFVLGRRPVEEPWRPQALHRYVNPTVGVVVNDVAKNILYGGTLELPAGISVMGGWHTAKVTRIPDGGPNVGTSLRGTGRTLRTEDVWRTKGFVSVALDLRAAGSFLSRLTK